VLRCGDEPLRNRELRLSTRGVDSWCVTVSLLFPARFALLCLIPGTFRSAGGSPSAPTWESIADRSAFIGWRSDLHDGIWTAVSLRSQARSHSLQLSPGVFSLRTLSFRTRRYLHMGIDGSAACSIVRVVAVGTGDRFQLHRLRLGRAERPRLRQRCEPSCGLHGGQRCATGGHTRKLHALAGESTLASAMQLALNSALLRILNSDDRMRLVMMLLITQGNFGYGSTILPVDFSVGECRQC
jgi:hypothetical protein